ncbi:LRR receptor-like serine/threonine-protein kinase ERL1 [Prunus yedoensis var. nudiflora]|uniref:LRR receptor-like serine/threonine-protein kinase ERL1 n=1 Tax=Prunus yedoensis var. nudiflora TaxID=2094558 RepID=A0A314YZN5_PRUYE|nr:LRR receptor-like serine/threonine-protein kinase ERL1 [Prunus yedoensis var. nudiflora]
MTASYELEAKLEDYRRAAAIRHEALEQTTGRSLEGLPLGGLTMSRYWDSAIPVGVAGPLLLDGKEYMVPLATTEGTLVANINRGLKAIYASGGAIIVLHKDAMTRAPIVRFGYAVRAAQLMLFVEDPLHFDTLAAVFNRGLQGNKLTGQIADEIGNCASPMHLDLSDNFLYGDIPFSEFEEQSVDWSYTYNSNPNSKPKNSLTGEIPRLIYWNEVLQYLGLHGNSLSGSLSPDMCQLMGLWYFDVRGNNLTGPIPDNIGNCTSFEILDISYNQITGGIPYHIGFLQVATLDLSQNELVGPIPPILGNLSYTGKLYLHGNKLTGPIPPEIGNMSELSYFF